MLSSPCTTDPGVDRAIANAGAEARHSHRALRHGARDSIGRDIGLAAGATAIAAAIGWMAERWIGLDDLSLIFIVAVVVVAARTRMAAAVLTSFLCFLAYNFIFIEPRLTLAIGASQGVATIVLFLMAALVAGRLASKLRTQVLALQAAGAHSSALQGLGRQLTTAADLEQVLTAARGAFKDMLDAEVVALLNEPAKGAEAPMALDTDDRAARDWALEHSTSAGRYTGNYPEAQWWFIPLLGQREPSGVLAVRFSKAVQQLSSEQRRLAEAMADEIAQAVVRTRLVAALEDARVTSQSEQLRSALLSSVSHDLRSPLAAIIGAASSLESYGASMSAEDRRSLLETIRLEGNRLDRYIQNLLDMTRLGHGGLKIRRDWIGIDELIGSAVTRLQRYQPLSRFVLKLPQRLRPVWVHPALIEQALFNVLENAAKFSPPTEVVTVEARIHEGALQIDVRDRGPGVPAGERERIFDMFYSVQRGDRGRQGTGLGLAICQGMIGAHGGTVEALPGSDSVGTTIRIMLPDCQPVVGSPS
jgi:two-component system sensor histidine kinase KdpD